MTNAELKTKLEDSSEFLKLELAQIRTGRVTPSLLDDVKVDAYGSMLTIKEVGTIQVLDPQTLQITPWDKNLLEVIESGIRSSELNLNPVVRGDSVVLPVPSLTEDRRKEFTRLVSTKMEDVKNSMRNSRQEAMKDIDTRFNDKEFGEDEKFTMKEEIEDLVKDYVEKTDAMGEAKKKDIMNI